MPFQSEAQRRFMYSQHPELAKEFEKATPKGADLPEHVKKMADGGKIQDEPGVQDATVSDFLAPYLLGPAVGRMAEGAEGAIPALEGLGETGAATLGPESKGVAAKAAEQLAPKMEEDIVGATTKDIVPPQVGDTVTLHSTTPGMPSLDVKYNGPMLKDSTGTLPPELAARAKEPMFNLDKDIPAHMDDVPHPANSTVSKSTLEARGYKFPTSYAQGGPVMRSSLAHPVPNGMMARAMNAGGYAEGGYPHVTFLENESPTEVKKDTHMEGHEAGPMDTTETGEKDNPPHMAEGGKTPHFLEGLKKGALHKEMGVSEDKKIPSAKLEKAANSDNETLRKRAQFAINAKKWHHAEGGTIPKEDPSHEDKTAAIYKAMGIKKYADGGPVGSTPAPTDNMGLPPQTDPGFLQALLASVKAGGQAGLNTVGVPTPAQVPPLEQNAAVGVDAIRNGEPSPAGPESSNLQGATLPAPAIPPVAPAATPPVAPAPVAPPASVGAPSTATTGMPDLSKIFNQDTSKLTEGVNPEDRQALVNRLQTQQHGLGTIIAQAVAGLGDALSAKGGKETHALGNIFSMEKLQRDEALANFDKARQDRVQKLQLQTQMGDNALKQAAAADAYGIDDHLNGLIGAPKGTMKKDLPTYFQLSAAQIAAREKDEDLYMKAHAQASTDVDNAVKNASMFNIKPSPAQLQASGQKLADNYYNRAKGNVPIKASDGSQHWIPAANVAKAKQIDPGVQVLK